MGHAQGLPCRRSTGVRVSTKDHTSEWSLLMAHLQAFLTQSQRFEEHQQGKSIGRAACKDGPI